MGNEEKTPLRILHLEDSPLDAELIRESLLELGEVLEIDLAASKADFLAYLEKGEYDIILADYRLRGFDASVALLSANSKSPNTPFICVSGAISGEEAVELLKHGATDYVMKDRLTRLPLAIRRALDEINEQKARILAEAKLIESESHLRTILENEPECIKIVDAKGKIIQMNPAGLSMIEADSVEQISNQPVLNLIAPEYRGAYKEMHERVIAGESVQLKFEIIGLKGGRRWLETHAVPMIENGKTVHLAVTRDITESKKAEEKINALLTEKEIILREVHHRIKNNMSTLNAFLVLQMETVTEPSAIEALKDAGSRVQSMMVLYDKLYQTGIFSNISIKSYLPALISQIISNFPNSGIVKIEQAIEDFVLDSKRLQPFSIIINELLTNIMKYAFKGREKGFIKIEVGLKTISDLDQQFIFLTIQDDGNGLPETVSFENSTGFGLTLVEMLTKQLKGILQIDRENGTKITLEFKK
ncbi:MAG TPA: histidine kinase dimerization/phosphoacceptor domain -containing protein [Leptospiraceae bacterium]|nr:histidine kinase dimerization/phosphoacceptor domain -containing protein [Leptospiraceae bacterium]HRG75005.1 histidine kinase dimerization/phosphoacceptor domain -containing protein [Leptospiraceae bacterium]